MNGRTWHKLVAILFTLAMISLHGGRIEAANEPITIAIASPGIINTGQRPISGVATPMPAVIIASPPVNTINGCQIKPSTTCTDANLQGANLAGANLTGAKLGGGNFGGANFSGATVTVSTGGGSTTTVVCDPGSLGKCLCAYPSGCPL